MKSKTTKNPHSKMNDYYNPTLKEWRLNQIKEKARNNPVKHSFVRGDLSDKELIDSLFSTYHFDVVANLAAQAGVRYYSNLQKNQQYPQDWNQPLQSSAMTRLRAALMACGSLAASLIFPFAQNSLHL